MFIKYARKEKEMTVTNTMIYTKHVNASLFTHFTQFDAWIELANHYTAARL